jgi:1-acyl-sn-glycerol-3-phosphate acyltransferase
MEAKQNILIYPGGGQEVLKHSSVLKYPLLWKEHLGFARLAIKHGYPIVPCASVGMEDMIDIVANINLKSCQKWQFLLVG